MMSDGQEKKKDKSLLERFAGIIEKLISPSEKGRPASRDIIEHRAETEADLGLTRGADLEAGKDLTDTLEGFVGYEPPGRPNAFARADWIAKKRAQREATERAAMLKRGTEEAKKIAEKKKRKK